MDLSRTTFLVTLGASGWLTAPTKKPAEARSARGTKDDLCEAVFQMVKRMVEFNAIVVTAVILAGA